MLIKHRLAISNNIEIMLIILITIFIVGGADWIFNGYYNEDMKVSGKSNIVLDYLKDYEAEILENKINFTDKDKHNYLENMIARNGYNLILIQDDEIIFSNLNDSDKKVFNELKEDTFFLNNSMILGMEEYKVVKETFMKDKKMFSAIAINSKGRIAVTARQYSLDNFYRSYMSLVVLLILVFIWMLNTVLSRRIAKSITEPLTLLQDGAKQIKDGNLDFFIKYEGDDEFKQVYEDFDEMRQRLKYHIQMQLKYEEDRKILVAGISHDLKTPLTVIKGYVEGLRDGIANTKEKKERYLDTIYNKSCDMDMLVDKLFLFSKLDTGLYPFHFVKTDVKKYIGDFYLKMKGQFNNADLDIEFMDHTQTPLWANVDCREMDRVLRNIIENSAKYKVKARGTVTITLQRQDKSVKLTIADDGIGVVENELTQIFTSFYRGDPARTKPCKGSGLGLAIANCIITAHGGNISAENCNGLKITIHLPLYKDEFNEEKM